MSVDTDLYSRLREDGVAAHQRIQQLEAENRELAEKLTAAREQMAADYEDYGDAVTKLGYRVKELEAALDNVIGFCDAAGESGFTEVEKARAALAGKKELP